MNEDKRIIELTATSELDATDFLPIDNSKSSSEENSGTRKIRVQTLLDSTLKVMLTQAEYDALPSSKLTDGKVYYITDESKIIINGVVYGAGGETVADVYENGVSVVDPTDKIARIKSYKEVTQAEYDALPSSKLTDDILYCIKDSEVSIVNDVRRNGTSIVNNGVADIAVDSTPTYNSTNLITSGGVSNAINPLQQQIGWLASAIEVELYNGSNTYNVGDYVWQNGSNSTIVLYKCIATTTGSWDSSKWEPVTVTSELEKKADKTYVDENIDKLLVHGTASGEIAGFSDGANLPMPSLKVAIEPIQDLHGYDAPWAGGAGKNKLLLTVDRIKSDNTSGSWSGNTYSINGAEYKINTDNAGNVTSISARNLALNPNGDLRLVLTLSSGSYILSSGFAESNGTNDSYLQKNGVTIARGNNSSPGSNFTLDSSSEVVYHLRLSKSGDSSYVAYPMIRLASVADATFAPYSNECPISGWSAVDVTRCGKNLWGGEKLADDIVAKVPQATKDTTNKTVTYFASQVNGKTLFDKFKENTRYTIYLSTTSTYTNAIIIYSDGTYDAIEPNTYKVTYANKTVSEIRGSWASGTTVLKYEECGIFEGVNTAQDFEPYNGQTYIIQLGSTYYGGKLDVVSGVLTVTHGIKVYSGNSSEGWYADGTQSGSTYRMKASDVPSNIKLPPSNTDAMSAISNQFIATSADNIFLGNEGVGIPTNGGYLTLYDSVYNTNDVSLWKTHLASNPMQLVYELATPIEIQLTPTQVKSLLGSNNVWADTGEIIECEYIRDTNMVINKLLEAIEN